MSANLLLDIYLYVVAYISALANTAGIDPYGSTESTRIDGTLVSALVTWDSKVTTVNAILGGVTQWVRQKMQADGIYNEFIDYATVCPTLTPFLILPCTC